MADSTSTADAKAPDTLVTVLLDLMAFTNKVLQREQQLNPGKSARLALLTNRLRALDTAAA